MTAPRLTLISVNYRTGPYLIRCLRSFEPALAGILHETVIVDNASGDGSPAEIRAAFPDAQVIENPANLGVSKAYNIGLRLARAPVAALINPDAEYREGAVEPLLEMAERAPGVGLVGARTLYPDGRPQPSAPPDTTPLVVAAHLSGVSRWLGEDFRRRLARSGGRWLPRAVREHLQVYRMETRPWEVAWLGAACLFIRKSMLDEIGYWDEDFFIYHDDEELGRRARALGWRSLYHPGLTVSHLVGAAGSGNPVVRVERYRSLLLLMAKCAPGSHLAATRLLLLGRFLPETCLVGSPTRRWVARQVCRLTCANLAALRRPVAGHAAPTAGSR